MHMDIETSRIMPPRLRFNHALYVAGTLAFLYMIIATFSEVHTVQESELCKPFCGSNEDSSRQLFVLDMQDQDIHYQDSITKNPAKDSSVGVGEASALLNKFVRRLEDEKDFDSVMITTTLAPIDENSILKAQYQREPKKPKMRITMPPFTLRPNLDKKAFTTTQRMATTPKPTTPTPTTKASELAKMLVEQRAFRPVARVSAEQAKMVGGLVEDVEEDLMKVHETPDPELDRMQAQKSVFGGSIIRSGFAQAMITPDNGKTEPTKFSWLRGISDVTTRPTITTTEATLEKQPSMGQKSMQMGGYSYPSTGYDGRFETPSQDVLVDAADNEVINDRIKRVQPANIPYLPNYKNPCWFEEVDVNTTYTGNVYAYFKDRDNRIRPAFEKFRKTLQMRRQKDGFGWLLRCLPFFYLVGAPRSGTTDLYSKMTMHPEIPSQIGKEPVYWNRARYLMPQVVATRPIPPEFKIPLSLKHYVEWFDPPSEKIRSTVTKNQKGKLPQHNLILGKGIKRGEYIPFHTFQFDTSGDFSPSYMYDFDAWRYVAGNGDSGPQQVVADHIKSVNPQAKIIFSLRNPIDRLLSDYLFWSPKNRKTPQEFHELVESNLNSFSACNNHHTHRFCLHDRSTHMRQLPIRPRAGLYYAYLQEWLTVFPREQILIVRFEDYIEKRSKVLKQIFDFLGVENMSEGWFSYITAEKPRNQSDRDTFTGSIWNSTRALLKDFYDPWNKKLAEYLEDDSFFWDS